MALFQLKLIVIFVCVLSGRFLNVTSFEIDSDEMLGEDESLFKFAHVKWPNAVIPYIIDDSLFDINDIILLLDAMNIFEQNTCVRFVDRLPDEPDYVKFVRGNGCSSYVARIGGEQTVSLGQGCEYLGTVLSLLAHTVGLLHEHNRPSRDQFTDILWENIHPAVHNQFMKIGDAPITILTPLDTESVTFYGEYAFSVNGKPTIRMDRHISLPEVYEKDTLSHGDIKGINKLYRC